MDQSYTDLLAAVAKQAIKDHAASFHHRKGIMPAAHWLKLAGLMTESGELDRRGVHARRQLSEASSEITPSLAGSEDGRVSMRTRSSDTPTTHPWRKT